jgi:hypothetical protein
MQAERGVARQGPGRVARQHVDFARLQGGEALLRLSGTYLTLFASLSTAAAMARQMSTSMPFQLALAVGGGKADHAGADAAGQLRPLPHLVEGFAGVGRSTREQQHQGEGQ